MTERRVIIVHPDGRRYSVTEDAFRALYEPEGYTVEGPETPAAFVADVPRSRRPRPAPRAKDATPPVSAPAADAEAPA